MSEGIKEADTVSAYSTDSSFVFLKGYYGGYQVGRDVHETREAALAAAESMRTKKIASLKKQVAKLEALRFE